MEAVQRAAVIKDRWLGIKGRLAKMVFVFCRQTVEPQNHIHASRLEFGVYAGPNSPAGL
jgi:hypothetical protein